MYDIIYIVNAMSLRLPNDTISHQYMYMFRIVSIQSLFDKNDKISTRLGSRSRMKQCRFKCLTCSRLYMFSAQLTRVWCPVARVWRAFARVWRAVARVPS